MPITDRMVRLVADVAPGLGRLLDDVRTVERVESLTDAELAEVLGVYVLGLSHRDPVVMVLESAIDRLRRAGGGPCSVVTPSGAALPACGACGDFCVCEHDQ